MTDGEVVARAEPGWILAFAGMTGAGVAVRAELAWIPAFAGMTEGGGNDGSRSFRGAYDEGILECQIAATDNEIDCLVYESYELTEEGIGIIDHQEILKLFQNPSHGRGIGENFRSNARHRHSRAGGNPGHRNEVLYSVFGFPLSGPSKNAPAEKVLSEKALDKSNQMC